MMITFELIGMSLVTRYKELKESLAELEKYVIEDGAKSDQVNKNFVFLDFSFIWIQLLDVFSLEIQMYMDQGDKIGVKKTYEKAIRIVESNPGTFYNLFFFVLIRSIDFFYLRNADEQAAHFPVLRWQDYDGRRRL